MVANPLVFIISTNQHTDKSAPTDPPVISALAGLPGLASPIGGLTDVKIPQWRMIPLGFFYFQG
jgi:hypothetical protein